MRQAGRALPEYRAARGPGSILDAIARPDLAAELTLQPVRRYGVDAAILFSDIVVPLRAVGVALHVVPARGRGGHPPRPRDDPPPGRRARGPFDRVLRRTVHPRQLSRRRRPVAHLR